MTSRQFKTDSLKCPGTSPMPTIEKSETASESSNAFSGATRDINAGETRFSIRPHRKDFASPLAAQSLPVTPRVDLTCNEVGQS